MQCVYLCAQTSVLQCNEWCYSFTFSLLVPPLPLLFTTAAVVTVASLSLASSSSSSFLSSSSWCYVYRLWQRWLALVVSVCASVCCCLCDRAALSLSSFAPLVVPLYMHRRKSWKVVSPWRCVPRSSERAPDTLEFNSVCWLRISRYGDTTVSRLLLFN